MRSVLQVMVFFLSVNRAVFVFFCFHWLYGSELTSLLCLWIIFGTMFAAKQWEIIEDFFFPPENPSILNNGVYFICRAEMMRAEFTVEEGRPARCGAV